MVEQWKSDGGTVIVEQWKSVGETMWVEQWHSEECWWKSVVEQWNSGTVMVEQCGDTVEQ